MNSHVEILGPFQVGRLIRKDFKYQMEIGAMNYGVKLQVIENKGFFTSSFTFHLSGEENDVFDFIDAVKTWCANYENR